MNEQLIVKNFGPIKDASVDFKRVTVFIGPTGGGKSTLAKLAAIFRGDNFFGAKLDVRKKQFDKFSLNNFIITNSWFHWVEDGGYESYEIKSDLTQLETFINSEKNIIGGFLSETKYQSRGEIVKGIIEKENYAAIKKAIRDYPGGESAIEPKLLNVFKQLEFLISESLQMPQPAYIPSNRMLLAAVEYSWAGMLRDDIGLPKDTLDFANDFSLSRKDIPELEIAFLNVKYLHRNGQDFIKIPESETLFRLYETASGIQSVTPMLVLLEHLSRNTEQAQSFIIEEPELNLYPTAQQGLLNWLVEKCTKGENDLTVTTHSPYLLAHLNTLLFAHQVAHNNPERADEVAKVVPRESWIDPKEFAAYHVEGQRENGVRSIINPETGLISYNGLDAIASAEAVEFEKLLDINAGLEVE